MIPGLPDRTVLDEATFQRAADLASRDPEVHRLYLIWCDAAGDPTEKVAYCRWQDALHSQILRVFKRGLDG